MGEERRGERVGKWRESEDQNEELRSHYESPCQTLSSGQRKSTGGYQRDP